MKISAISDVHVKDTNDKAHALLVDFFAHPLVQDSDYILLLGDIFDLMCGPHEEYLRKYQEIFSKMDELQKKGKKIFFFEGNHDVHLEKLFKKLWKNGEIIISQDAIVEEIEGKLYYFSHGDEHEIDNISYQKYIRFIRSAPLKFIAEFVMPYSLLNYLGERASRMSRKKGYKKFNEEKVRSRFRSGVLEKTKGAFDFVLGGHSHVQDQWILPESKSLYLNNGFALQSKTFIYIENHEFRFEPLS